MSRDGQFELVMDHGDGDEYGMRMLVDVCRYASKYEQRQSNNYIDSRIRGKISDFQALLHWPQPHEGISLGRPNVYAQPFKAGR